MTKMKLMQLAFEQLPAEQALDALNTQDPSGLVESDDADLVQAHEESDKLDALISTTGAMEQIHEHTKQALAQGGLSYHGAKSLLVAFEHFSKAADVGNGQRVSLESFQGGRIMRERSTAVALEDMGETIRRTIKKVLAWLKHIVGLCYEVIERVIRGANAVIERAHALQKIAGALLHKRFNQEKIGNITSSKLTSFFNDNGKPMDAREVVEKFQSYCSDVNDAFNAGKMYGPAVRALDELGRHIKHDGEKGVDLAAVEGFAAKACEQLYHDSLNKFTRRAHEGAEQVTRQLPFGNNEMVFSFVKGTMLTDQNVGFHADIITNPVSKAAPLKAMSPQEVMNLCSIVITEMGKGIYRDSKQIRASIREVGLRVEKQSYALSDNQRQLGATAIPTLNLIKLISDESLKATKLLYAYSGVATRRLLAYAQQSLSIYDKAAI